MDTKTKLVKQMEILRLILDLLNLRKMLNLKKVKNLEEISISKFFFTKAKKKTRQKSSMIPVEGHKNLFRDEKTNAIINKDTIAYENYMRMRKRNDDKQAEMDAMKKET